MHAQRDTEQARRLLTRFQLHHHPQTHIRFLLGAMNGLVAISKCMISEICGKEHETVGMSFVTGEQLLYAWLTEDGYPCLSVAKIECISLFSFYDC